MNIKLSDKDAAMLDMASKLDAMATTLADVQTRLYALADRLPNAADRIEVMAIHSLVGTVVYDAIPK